MKQCPLCLGQIPDAAVKCQHCGEWVDGRGTSGGGDQLGRAANRYVSFTIVMGVIGLIVALFFVFVIWLPQWNRMERNFNNFPSFPPVQRQLVP